MKIHTPPDTFFQDLPQGVYGFINGVAQWTHYDKMVQKHDHIPFPQSVTVSKKTLVEKTASLSFNSLHTICVAVHYPT